MLPNPHSILKTKRAGGSGEPGVIFPAYVDCRAEVQGRQAEWFEGANTRAEGKGKGKLKGKHKGREWGQGQGQGPWLNSPYWPHGPWLNSPYGPTLQPLDFDKGKFKGKGKGKHKGWPGRGHGKGWPGRGRGIR